MLRHRVSRVFSPPLYLQRHQYVIEFVKKSRPRTVLDLGCSECSLLRKLRFHRHGVELLAGVDTDCAAIRQNMAGVTASFHSSPTGAKTHFTCLISSSWCAVNYQVFGWNESLQPHPPSGYEDPCTTVWQQVKVLIYECSSLCVRYALAPLMTEYLLPNARPLTIKLYQGSITKTEPCTKGFDLITCIEVMEHLQLWEVERFSEVLFEYMEPRTVIISMPNAEFNPLLPGLTGFRHKDHKFEWTRAQFQVWANGICRKYGYSVEFTGVGEAPGGLRDVGYCSQIGVFQRVVGDLNEQRNNTELEPTVYQLLYKVVYPNLCDNNIFQRTLVSEVLYRAEQLKKEWLESQEGEQCDFTTCELMPPFEAAREEKVVYRQGSWVCVPLLHVWAGSKVQVLCRDIQQLRDMLLVDLQVQLHADRDAIMLPDDYEEEEDKEELEEGEKAEHESRSVNDNVEDWESEL